MAVKFFLTVFATVFVAELGDKTQLATLLLAADARNPKLTVLVASAVALILSSTMAVLAGSFVSEHASTKVLSWIAGLGFVIIGVWTIARA